MFHDTVSFSVRRSVRRCSLFVVVALACAFLPGEARAATARVRWLPSTSDAITRYDIYVRSAGAPYDRAAWSGNPSLAADGTLDAMVPFTPATSGANYFAIVAVAAGEESMLSQELSVGTPIPCRIDSCTSKTTCDFGNAPDGTFCDVSDADPCSAVCVAGTCGTTSGSGGFDGDVSSDHMWFTQRPSGVLLSLRAKIAADTALAPDGSGAVIELRGADGSPLWTASVSAGSFTANRTGRRFVFHASKADADPAWNGLVRLDLRRNGSAWLMTARARTPALADALAEPSVTLVVRLGTSCIRRVGAQCEQRPPVSICR